MPTQTTWPPPKPRHDKARTALDMAIDLGHQGYSGLKARIAEAAKVQPGQVAQAQLGRRPLTIEQYRAVSAYLVDAKGMTWATLPWLLMDRARLSGGITIENVNRDYPDVVDHIAVHLAALPRDQRNTRAALGAVHAALYAHDEGWHQWRPDSPSIVAAATAEYAQAAGILNYVHALKAAEAFVRIMIATHKPATWAELRSLFEQAIDRFEHPQNRQAQEPIP
jgi:hypothetical protein